MKILQIGMGNVAGGLEAFVMNYYRVLVHMDIQFDFVCMYDKIAYEAKIRKMLWTVCLARSVRCRVAPRARNRIITQEMYQMTHL